MRNNNNLHSGPDGYDYRLWNVEEADDRAVTIRSDEPGRRPGIPGKL